jgi:PEP-CTERM motif
MGLGYFHPGTWPNFGLGGVSEFRIYAFDPVTELAEILSRDFSLTTTFTDEGVIGIQVSPLLPPDTSQAPEPSSIVLIGIALACLGFSRRRKLH